MTSATVTEGAMSRADIEAMVVKRCWTDEAFRRELLADPVACFVKYTGLTSDKAPTIRIHEESGRDWHIVIPAKPRQADELSDADLERVAGGTDPVVSVTVTIATAVVTSGISIGSIALSAATIEEVKKW